MWFTYQQDGGSKDKIKLGSRMMIKNETFLMETKEMTYLKVNFEDDCDVVMGILRTY